ncbi:MAG: YbjN domain-containing protein [Sphingomonadaceae bacterium]
MQSWRLPILFLGLTVAFPASAADTEKCATNMVCASNPQSVVDGLQNAGFKAKLDKDSTGDPMVTSAASGYNFTVFFYECEKAASCASVQLNASFEADDQHSAGYANDWNRKKRFIQASVNDKKEVELRYDVTTIGGINQRNFKDVIEWWSSMLGEYSNFVAARPKEEAASAPSAP